MTTIRLGVLHPTGTAADERSTGSMEWVPTARRVVGADVILPDAFRVTLVADADVTVVVAPTTTAWVWRVLERVKGGSGGWRYLAVPDSAEVVDYAALVEVDPATLDPIDAAPTVAAELALLAPLASPAFIGTPTGITKAHVGLGSVDNTADAAKPVSTAQAAALAGKAGRAKDDNGGQFLAPVRVPVLCAEETWPNRRAPYLVCWADGLTLYAHGRDGTLRKSVDGGKTWTKRGYNTWGFGSYASFLKLSTGTLLNISSASPPTIQRSADDGATWTAVHTYRASTTPLGSQSWAVNPITGHIFYGEYNTALKDDVNLYRSTDDGATWTVFHTWPGTLGSDPARIAHIHAVQWDHIAQRIVICAGDSTPDTGLWRIDAAGTGVEKIVTNSMLPAGDIDLPRAIGIMPFPDYIAWAGDSTQNPYLARMARTEIGATNPVVEKVYRLNSTAWFTCRASDDGSRWVLSASEEGATALDSLVHLYAVEDQGATVWEVGALAAPTTTAAGSLQPVGAPGAHGDNFYLITRGFDPYQVWKFRMGKGVTAIPRPEPLPDVLVPQTRCTPGPVTLAPSAEYIFGYTVAGGYARRLHVLESSIAIIDQGGAAGGSQRIQIRKASTAYALQFSNFSERYSSRLDMGTTVGDTLFASGDNIEILIKNTSATATTIVAAAVTFGWGTA